MAQRYAEVTINEELPSVGAFIGRRERKRERRPAGWRWLARQVKTRASKRERESRMDFVSILDNFLSLSLISCREAD